MIALIVLSLIVSAIGDQCTEHVHAKFGKSGKCLSKSCCAYSTYISDLCPGDNACCFTHDTCGSAVLGGCPHIISRASWGARASRSNSYLPSQPVHWVFIHHGESSACHSQSQCSGIVRSYQNYHMDTHGWGDIGYSFLVGEDGNAYEGRGWDRIGAHTVGYNSKAVGGSLDCSGGHRYSARGTGYYPANNALEGGFVDMRGHNLRTLQDYIDGKASYVSVAMDNKAGISYGTAICIPELNHKYGRNIVFKVVDTGSAFFGKGHSRIDICVRSRSYSYDSTINNHLTLVFP